MYKPGAGVVGKLLKIALITLLVLLVLFAAIADSLMVRNMLGGLNLATYLRFVGILGLIIAAFLAWGHKRKIEASQKYRRAGELLAEAEAVVQRKQQACKQMEDEFKATFDQQKQQLEERIVQIEDQYKARLRDLKGQNIALKETVGKLMDTIKQLKRSQKG